MGVLQHRAQPIQVRLAKVHANGDVVTVMKINNHDASVTSHNHGAAGIVQKAFGNIQPRCAGCQVTLKLRVKRSDEVTQARVLLMGDLCKRQRGDTALAAVVKQCPTEVRLAQYITRYTAVEEIVGKEIHSKQHSAMCVAPTPSNTNHTHHIYRCSQ
ncbi:MAG TPA: hypothetical protein VK157_13905 [Phycisphaerales bacterium]|nr:hypothetical protein [Phycisphaerales bacterium]